MGMIFKFLMPRTSHKFLLSRFNSIKTRGDAIEVKIVYVRYARLSIFYFLIAILALPFRWSQINLLNVTCFSPAEAARGSLRYPTRIDIRSLLKTLTVAYLPSMRGVIERSSLKSDLRWIISQLCAFNDNF